MIRGRFGCRACSNSRQLYRNISTITGYSLSTASQITMRLCHPPQTRFEVCRPWQLPSLILTWQVDTLQILYIIHLPLANFSIFHQALLRSLLLDAFSPILDFSCSRSTKRTIHSLPFSNAFVKTLLGSSH